MLQKTINGYIPHLIPGNKLGTGDGLHSFCGVYTATNLGFAGHLYGFAPTTKQKEYIKKEILKAGSSFEMDIRLCMSMKGITPFLVLAFLADAGDITRFKNIRGLNS